MCDPRWEQIVVPRMHDLVTVLDVNGELLDRLTAKRLVTRDEWQQLRLPSVTRREKARDLLMDMLPRKGRHSYDKFVAALRETCGQEQIVEEILNEPSEEEEKEGGEVKLKEEIKQKATATALHAKDIVNEGRKLIELGLRIKYEDPGWTGTEAKWDMTGPDLPVLCNPFGCVAEIDACLTVGWGETIYCYDKSRFAWEKIDVDVDIWSLFECEQKCYVLGCDTNKRRKLFEWNSTRKELEEIAVLPKEHQLFYVAAIGSGKNIYVVGGYDCGVRKTRINCYNLDTKKWVIVKDIECERYECSLAIIDSYLFIGGGRTDCGWASNVVEILPLSGDGSTTSLLPTTTKNHCQLASVGGKLVATGGFPESDFVEVYDSSSRAWLPLPAMNTGRHFHGTCRTAGYEGLIVVGGVGAGGSVECLSISLEASSIFI